VLAARRLATLKQRISHWVTYAVSLAYEVRGLPSPLSIKAHSTRGVASSQALFRGALLEDICVAAGWSSPHTFVKFYNLDFDTTPGSQVLSAHIFNWCLGEKSYILYPFRCERWPFQPPSNPTWRTNSKTKREKSSIACVSNILKHKVRIEK